MVVRRLLAVLAALLLFAAACSSDDSSPEESDGGGSDDTTASTADPGEPVDGGTLVFGVEAESDGYNPVANRWSIAGNLIGSAVYETLTVVTSDGTVEPWLAESVAPNDDGTEWTITAKPDITFHDGSELNAEVIAANLQARVDGLLTGLANEPIESVEVVDDMTVSVTMSTPWLAWDHALASQSGYIMGQVNVDDPAADPVGTGPYAWAEHVEGDQVTVEKYGDYWRDGLPHLDAIEFRIIVDEQAREQSLDSDTVDAIMTQTPQSIAEYVDTDLTVVEDSSDTHVVMLNAAAPPFDDPVAREAVVTATDNEALVETLYGSEVSPATGPFASEQWQLEDTNYAGYDPDRATELVEQYEEESGEPLSFSLEASQGQDNADRLATLAAQYEAVGMEVEQVQTEQAVYINQVIAGDYEAGLFRNFSWADPDFNFLFWHSSTAKGVGDVSVNFTQTVNDDLDAGLERGRGNADPDERKEAYDDVQRALNDEFAYVWLFHSRWAIVSDPQVHGWDEAVDRGWSRQDSKIFWADLWLEA
jgi:ABC-type transport system substrate-binding protein